MVYFRVFLALLLFLLAGCLTNVWSSAVQPELSGDLAMEQFANPSIATDTASRTLTSVQIPILWSGTLLIVWLMFRKDVICFCSNFFKGDEDEDASDE